HDERTGVSLAMAPWRPPSRRARYSPVPPDGRTKGLLRHRALMLPRDGRIGAFLPMVASVPCLAMGARVPCLAMGASVPCLAMGAPAVLAVCMVPASRSPLVPLLRAGGRGSRWRAGCDCLSRLVVATACQLDEPPARGFPGSLVARPRRGGASIAEGARDEFGGDLLGSLLVAGGGELEELVILVAATQGGHPQRGLAAWEREDAVEVAVVLAVVEADRVAQVELAARHRGALAIVAIVPVQAVPHVPDRNLPSPRDPAPGAHAGWLGVEDHRAGERGRAVVGPARNAIAGEMNGAGRDIEIDGVAELRVRSGRDGVTEARGAAARGANGLGEGAHATALLGRARLVDRDREREMLRAGSRSDPGLDLLGGQLGLLGDPDRQVAETGDLGAAGGPVLDVNVGEQENAVAPEQRSALSLADAGPARLPRVLVGPHAERHRRQGHRRDRQCDRYGAVADGELALDDARRRIARDLELEVRRIGGRDRCGRQALGVPTRAVATAVHLGRWATDLHALDRKATNLDRTRGTATCAAAAAAPASASDIGTTAASASAYIA